MTNLASLVQRLERSRAALINVLAERTEADFAHTLDAGSGAGTGEGGETVGHALAALARAERIDLANARSEQPPDRDLPERPLPPQVTHDLAGARHQTLAHLANLDHHAAAEALVDAITSRESVLVARIGTVLGSPTTE